MNLHISIDARVREHDHNRFSRRYIWEVVVGDEVVEFGYESNRDRAELKARAIAREIVERAWEKARKMKMPLPEGRTPYALH